jgi:hypothetical protein
LYHKKERKTMSPMRTAAATIVAALVLVVLVDGALAAPGSHNCEWAGKHGKCPTNTTCCGYGFWADPVISCCPGGTECCGTTIAGAAPNVCVTKNHRCCTNERGAAWACPANQYCGPNKADCMKEVVAARVCPTSSCSANHAANPACSVVYHRLYQCEPVAGSTTNLQQYTCAYKAVRLTVWDNEAALPKWAHCTQSAPAHNFTTVVYNVSQCYETPATGGSVVFTSGC